MQKKALTFIHKHHLFDGKKILAAISGGVDSMVLLHFLLSVSISENIKLAAVHFEHGIRGEESKDDADFVKDFCEKNDIECFMGAGNALVFAKENKITIEMAARILRYNFFNEILEKEKFDKIATAHHADDQAETVLLNLLRGAGVKGLAAMRPERKNIIRPFLAVTKEEIEQYAKINNIEFREDSTNKSLEYRRNRIRCELLPLLESYQKGIKERLVTLSEIARVESDYLDDIAKKNLKLLKTENLEKFRVEPLAIQRRIILEFMNENGILTDFKHIEEIRKMLLKADLGKRIEISKNIFTELSYKGLQIVKESSVEIAKKDLIIPGINVLEDFKIKITAKFLDKAPEKTSPNEYYVDYDKITEKIGVRARICGDVIELAFGKKSVKKIFTEGKIERSKRDSYPIIFSGKNILWLPNLRRSVLYKPSRDTRCVLYMKVEEI